MKLEALDHPKTLDFAARLQVTLPTAIGHLELFWAFVAKKAPQGNVGKWADGSIALSAMWTGEPSVFVAALIEAGFLDESQEHRLLVHDWQDHMPNWVRAALKKSQKKVLSADLSVNASMDLSSDLSTHLRGDSVREGKGREEKGSQQPGAQARVAIPDWVPTQAWTDYAAMRNRIRKPMTPRAEELAIAKLDELRRAGHDPRAVLEQSVMNSWQGLFEVRRGSGKVTHLPGARPDPTLKAGEYV